MEGNEGLHQSSDGQADVEGYPLQRNKQFYVCIAAEGEAHNIVSCLTFVKIDCFVIKTIANVKRPNVLGLMDNTLIC